MPQLTATTAGDRSILAETPVSRRVLLAAGAGLAGAAIAASPASLAQAQTQAPTPAAAAVPSS